MAQRPGNSLIEVLLAVGITTIVVATVGNLIVSVDRVDRASAHKDQALGYARESLEIMAAIANQEFSRTSCSPAPPPGYTSCWVACPLAVPSCTSSTVYRTISSGGNWELVEGNAQLGSNPEFTRSIKLTSVSGDPATKQVTAEVTWKERGQDGSCTPGSRRNCVQLETIVTGWKNL